MIFWITSFIIFPPIALFILYAIGIQYERGGKYKVLIPFTFIALILDYFVNILHITIFFFDKPLKVSLFLGRREYTFSDRLERLVFDTGIRGIVSRFISKVLNKIAPFGDHIKNLRES